MRPEAHGNGEDCRCNKLLNIKYKQYLKEEGQIDRNLKKAFDDKKAYVSNRAHITKIEDKRKWEVKDGFNQYTIEVVGTHLNVYYSKFDISLLGVLDYRAYYKLEKKQLRELHFVFIDVKNLTIKPKICSFLHEKKITSFNLASDMDIIAIVLSSRDGIEQFQQDILDFDPSIECHLYRAQRPLFLERKRVATAAPEIPGKDIDAIVLSKIQKDYTNPSLKREYETLRDTKVLLGHTVLYDFIRIGELRDFALIYNIDQINEPQFYQYDEIKRHIIDLYALDYVTPPGKGIEDDYTTFYSGARYLAFLEFTKSEERAVWEKMVGTIFKDSNAFFFPISDFIFLGPYGVSDVVFDTRCSSYSREDNKVILLGNAIRNGLELPDEKVGLELNSVNGNGVILGESQTGKSTTMRRLIEGFVKHKLTVHVLNPTQDTLKELQKAFGDKLHSYALSELKKCKNGFDDFRNEINVFSIDDHPNAKDIVDAIKAMPQLTPVSRRKKSGGQKYRPIKHVLMIDEAHDFFVGSESEENKEQFANILEKISHYGIAMYIITQKLSHLRIHKKKSLASFLQNRIIHRMLDDEAKAVALMLAKDGVDAIYRLDEEVLDLPQLVVFFSFIDHNRNSMPPLKVQIYKEAIL